MRNALEIVRRDVHGFAHALRTYVAVALLLTLYSAFFYADLTDRREASMRDMFRIMGFLSLFVVPIFTMGSIADERRAGTMEFLLTCPVRHHEVVIGKFLACAVLYTGVVALTLPFYAMLAFLGEPDTGPVLSGYLGLLLSGYLYVAVGVYTSSLTKSPLVAALLSYVILLLAWMVGSVPQYFGALGPFVQAAGIGPHLSSFESGMLSSADLAYFLSGTLSIVGVTVWGFSASADRPID